MSNEKWYSITTPEQLIEAVTEGLHVECMRQGIQLRKVELSRGQIVLLGAGNSIMDDVPISDIRRIRQWFEPFSKYKYWKVLDKAGRIPYRTLPV